MKVYPSYHIGRPIMFVILMLSIPMFSVASSVLLTPPDFSNLSSEERLQVIYHICNNHILEQGETVEFLLDGCSGPILISREINRSGQNPNEISKNELLLSSSPYTVQLPDEGRYILFCDDSFKTLAGCITISSEVESIDPTNSIIVPTMNTWGQIIAFLTILITAIVYLSRSVENNKAVITKHIIHK